MKDKTVRKINRLGHFSQVVTLIMKIIVIIMLLGTAVATVLSFGLPDNTLELTTSTNADVSMDIGFSGKTISKTDQEALLSGKGDIASSLFDGSGGSLNDTLKESGGTIQYKKVTDHFINAVISNAGSTTYTMNEIRFGLLAALIQIALFLILLFVASAFCKALRYCNSPFEKSLVRRMRGFAFTLLIWVLAVVCTHPVLDYMAGRDIGKSDLPLGLLFLALIVLALTRIYKYGAAVYNDMADLVDEALLYDDLDSDGSYDGTGEDAYDALPSEADGLLYETGEFVIDEPETEFVPEAAEPVNEPAAAVDAAADAEPAAEAAETADTAEEAGEDVYQALKQDVDGNL